MKKKVVFPVVAGLLGFILILLASILGWIVLPNIIEDQIEKEIQLVPDTEAWDRFQENPVPVFIEFYIFNITNPDFIEKRELPIVEEKRPYVFEESRIKTNFEFHEDDTITYMQNISYFFQPHMSTQNPSIYEQDFTILNAPLLIVSQAMYELLGPLANFLIELFLIEHGETFVRTRVSADEIIFSGMPLIPSYNFILSILDEIPPNFEDGRFGFYRGMNQSDDGVYLVHNGVRNPKDVGRVIRWNDERFLNWWSSPTWHESNKFEDIYCNFINGTDGTTFPPFLKKSDVLQLFVTDICRSLYLHYDKEVKHRGIPGYRFVLPESFYEDPKVNEDNYCFCPTPPAGLNDSCPDGVNRMFTCQDGAPIVASSPNFFMAGGEVMENALAMGMKPEAEKHQTRVDLESNTGSVLSIHKRLQINMELQTFTGVNYFSNVRHMFCPIFWVDEYADIDEKNADDIKSSLLTPLKIINASKWSVLAIGIVLVVASTVIFIWLRRR